MPTTWIPKLVTNSTFLSILNVAARRSIFPKIAIEAHVILEDMATTSYN